MKISKMSLLWFTVSLVLGGVLIAKTQNESRQKHKIEQLQLQVEESTKAARLAQTKAEEQEMAVVKSRSELRAAEMEAFKAKQQATATNQAMNSALRSTLGAGQGAGPQSPGNGASPQGGNPIAQMLKDPEMRKMIQAQQNAMVGMMYGPLIKKLGLTPEEGDKLKAILAETQGKATEMAGSLLEADGEAKQAALKQMTDQQQEGQRQLKELLGEDRFSKFQEYTSTMGERMMMSQFQQQHNLAPEKMDQILDLIRQEKQAAQMPDMNSAQGSQEFMNMMNQPEAFQKLIEQQKLVNDRVVQRAATVLSPEELKDFTEFQANQAKMQQIGLETAAKMFSPGQPKPPTEAPVPVQPTPVTEAQ